MTTAPTPLRFHQRGEGWHLDPPRNVFLKALGVLVLVVFVMSAAARLVAGHPVQAACLAVVGAALGAVPFERDTRRLPVHTVTVHGERGLLIPTHPVKISMVLVMCVLALLLLGGGLAVIVEGARQGEVPALFGGAATAAVGGLMALGAYGAVQGRRARDRGLLLLPDALVLRTSRQPARLPWTEIAGFRDHWSRPGRKVLLTEVTDRVDNWLSVESVSGATWAPDPLRLLSGTSSPTLKATTLAVDPVEVLTMLRLYLDRPDLRAALGSAG